jgi:hypothetical protein
VLTADLVDEIRRQPVDGVDAMHQR